jgi:hypothetical protein
VVRKILALAALTVAVSGTSAFAATTIDTTPQATSTLGVFGIVNTATFGQTVTVPAGETTLDSFSFVFKTVPSTVAFRGEVYAWDAVNLHATGPALFESAAVSTTGATQQTVTFPIPGGVTVTPGAQYVIFVSTSRDQAGHSGQGNFADTPDDTAYTGGSLFFQNNGPDPTQWTSTAWSHFNADAGFIAQFGPVAGPGSVPTLTEWALIVFAAMVAGLGGLLVPRRRLFSRS